MAILRIPVFPSEQSYQVAVELENVEYILRFRYNTRLDRMHMDILTIDEADILTGAALETGTAPFFSSDAPGLPPGVFSVISLESDDQSPPTDEDFGVRTQLIYITSDDPIIQ